MVKLSSCSVDTLYSLTLQCDKFNQKIQQHFCIGFVTYEPPIFICINGGSANYRVVIRVSQKYTFFEFRFVGRITGANGCPEATKKFQRYKSPYGHIFGHMAIGPYATNMGKWGIPGKSYKNVAQQC